LINVDFNDDLNFTPLFLAEDEITSADRRYGTLNEQGDDNWARALMIDYLESVPYRFNDVSSQHVTQRPSGKNILHHARHSDGLSADFRYVDPDGNTDESFGRAVNGVFPFLTMITDAQAEAVAGNGIAAQLELIDFILTNRAVMETESPSAEAIFIGNNSFWDAFTLGLYPNNTMIMVPPTPEEAANGAVPVPLGAWTSRPNNVSFARDHIDHWHITIREDLVVGGGGDLEE